MTDIEEILKTDEPSESSEKKPEEKTEPIQEQNLDWYKEELKKTNELLGIKDETLLKKEEIINHKNRAIESLKKNGQIDAEAIKKSLKEELMLEVRNEVIGEVKNVVNQDRVSREIAKYAGDNESAKQLIKLHYEKFFKNSDLHQSIEDKIEAAALLANKDLILRKAKEEGMETKREEILSTFTSSKSSSGREDGASNDPVVQLLKRTRPDVLKNPNVQAKLRK